MSDEGENLRPVVEAVKAQLARIENRLDMNERRTQQNEEEIRRSNERVETKMESLSKDLAAHNAIALQMQHGISDIALKADGTHTTVTAMKAGQETAQKFEERYRFWITVLTAVIVAILGAFLQVWFALRIH